MQIPVGIMGKIVNAFVFCAIEHDTRRVHLLGITLHPTDEWIANVLRTATDDGATDDGAPLASPPMPYEATKPKSMAVGVSLLPQKSCFTESDRGGDWTATMLILCPSGS
jgi:hypothetical protein